MIRIRMSIIIIVVFGDSLYFGYYSVTGDQEEEEEEDNPFRICLPIFLFGNIRVLIHLSFFTCFFPILDRNCGGTP